MAIFRVKKGNFEIKPVKREKDLPTEGSVLLPQVQGIGTAHLMKFGKRANTICDARFNSRYKQ